MKLWKAFLVAYAIGMVVSHGHIYREASERMIHRCLNPATKQEACFDTMYYDSPEFVSFWSTLFWPYHWSAVAWRKS